MTRRTQLPFIVVLPLHQRRHRHQNGLRPPPGLQAKQCAAIEDEVELDVTPAAVELEIPLSIAVLCQLAAFQDGLVGGGEAIPNGLGELEARLEVPGQLPP